MGRPKGSWCGENNPRYRGGRYVASGSGYVFIRKPLHPNADKRGYVREHVYVMSEAIGRPIAKGEVVHHINGVKTDNRIENLELMKIGQHASHHHLGVVKPASIANLRRMTPELAKQIWDSGVRDEHRAKPKTCDHCGAEFFGERLFKYGLCKHIFCSRDCFQQHRKAQSAAAASVSV